MERLFSGANTVSALLVALVCVAVFLSVGSRYFFGRPFHAIVELVEYSLLAIPLLSGAWLAQHDGHVRLEIISDYVTRRTTRWLDIVAAALGAGVALFILGSSLWMAYLDFSSGISIAGVLRLDRWPFMLLISAGMLLLAIQQAMRLVDLVKDRGNK